MFSKNRTLVMGILNVTPDSFSDGGKFFDVSSAIKHAEEMIKDGADIIDIGGQSTRPGFTKISDTEELERIAPIVETLVKTVNIPISIDTFYPSVAEECAKLGATIINDTTGFTDSTMIAVAAKYKCGCIVMHNINIEKADAVSSVREFFLDRINALKDAGIDDNKICLDPGIGFGKTNEQNLELISNFDEVCVPPYLMMIAASRKRVIGSCCNNPPFEDRLAGTIAAHTATILRGAGIIRVHDVYEGVQAARMADAIMEVRH